MPALRAWRRLSDRNKAVSVAVLIAIALAVAALGRAATTPRLSLLYAGLDAAASGEVLQALESLDVAAEVRGDAIYVPENKRDATRMALAREGLPNQSQAGFEILDDLKSFATSSEMFDATYWRAKEGELARTILAEPGVRSARVHLAIPKKTAFSRTDSAPSAVVTIRMSFGRLSVERAQAVRLLIALAVPGLSPDKVAVLDAAGGVILAPGAPEEAHGFSGKAMDREKAIERDLIQMLEASVGAGNARVKVTLVTSDDQVVRQERLVDPDKRALLTSDSMQTTEQGSEAAGVVTVASNLPEGDAAPSTSPAQSRRSENTENLRYEISEVKTEMVTLPGALRQVQVAVLINHAITQKEDGSAVLSPRTETELEAIRTLVAAAIGFNEARGDVVTIQSLPFDEPKPAGTEETGDFISDVVQPNLVPILQLVIPALVTLILALFVLRPLLSERDGALPAPRDAQSATLLGAAPSAPQQSARPEIAPFEDMQRLAAEDKNAASAVLKSWLEESEPAR